MTTILEIPLTPEAQTFSVLFGNVEYNLTLVWNNYSNNWNLSIANIDGDPLVYNLPLLANVDILVQLKYLRIGDQPHTLKISGELRVISDLRIDQNPTFDDLGITSHLIFTLL